MAKKKSGRAKKTKSIRNINVEEAVSNAIGRIDAFINGDTLVPPEASARHETERQLRRPAGTRVASVFLAFYSVLQPDWDFNTVPQGARGKYGDKRFSDELKKRKITLNGTTVAFGENLGWKGNVRNVRLSRDPRFKDFAAMLKAAGPAGRKT